MTRKKIESVRDYAIVMLDPEGRINSWNEGAARLMGYDAAEVIGQPAAMLFAREERDSGTPRAILDVARRTGSYRGRHRRTRKDGRSFWAEVTITPVHDASGALLGYFSMAYISRMTRSFMLNELGQEYVVAARAKGLSETRIIWGHALRNAAVPLVTVIALSYAGLLEGSVLTETVFAWPGLGLYITNSLQNADMNAVLGGTIVIGSVFIAINLLSDVLYRMLDPRTRTR